MRLSVICIVVIIAASFAAALPRIFPEPKLVTYSDTTFDLDPSFSFKASGVSSETLTNAFTRYRAIIVGKSNGLRTDASFHGIPTRAAVRNPNAIASVTVDVASKDEDLHLDTNESYSIDTTSGNAVIKAQTVYGALRGLESFSQIVDKSLKMRGVTVYDEPRFPYRGFLLDTARHFYPVSVILQHLDAMAYAKLNVLHWHIVDDTSFPYESITFPEMSATGAFSPKHVYTQADIATVIAYARARGIRVIPEFDVPGHVTKGYDALDPPILTKCYDPVPYKTGPLNPTIQATYDFLDKFYDELKYVWTDGVFHIGGDEVIKRCWKSNPEIVAWMEKHPEIDGYDGLQNYFIERLLDMLKGKGLSYMAWQEVFDSGADLLPDTVVEVWIPDGWRDTIKRVVESKRRAVLAAPFYLNLIKYGLDWPEFYKTDPADFPGGPAAEDAGHITGVEVCMWSEYVDATNFIPRSWARTAAVAERGWSPKDVVDVNEAQRRMHEWRCKMLRRGINAEPITNGANMTSPVGFAHNCEDEWEVRYTPPWV